MVNGTRVRRSEISYIFNAKETKINPNKGKWLPTLTGEVNINKHLRRGGYIGVRRKLPNGKHVLLDTIHIPARPNAKTVRHVRREIYDFDKEVLRNPLTNTANFTAPALEIMVGNDKGIFSKGVITTEFLKSGETFAFPHDNIPKGTPGRYRIAPIEAVNFVRYDGETRYIKDLLANGVDYVSGYGYLQELVDAGGSFGSAPIKFKLPNQPKAPATDKMAMTAGKNGAPWFISKTNDKMSVKLGYGVDGKPVWGQLAKNVTLQALAKLFADGAFELPPVVNDEITFEIRNIRPNKPRSAPGYLNLPADEFEANQAILGRVE